MNRLSQILLPLCLMALATAGQTHDGVNHTIQPRHGGAVQTYQSLHYEVVLVSAGGLRVYFSDAARQDLPASAVSRLGVEIQRPGQKAEVVRMAIDPTGEFWGGRSLPVKDPRSVVRLSFVSQGRPALIDLPGSFWPAPGKPVRGGGQHK